MLSLCFPATDTGFDVGVNFLLTLAIVSDFIMEEMTASSHISCIIRRVKFWM